MLTSSAKAKGRRLQQYVRDTIQKRFNLDATEVQSTGMGQAGLDIQLSERARMSFPYGVECKAQEGLGKLYGFYQQAKENAGQLTPIVVLRSNKKEALVILKFDDFMAMKHGN